MSRLAYHPGYDIGFFGIERLHPFYTRKYSRAWRLLREEFGEALDAQPEKPSEQVSTEELASVHAVAYLEQLKSSSYLAKVLELAAVAVFPASVVDSHLLAPMRLAARGSMLAARAAMRSGFTANLSGGYHHAKPESGEGFCVYSDIALAVHALRKNGALSNGGGLVYIDLDAHQGNGVCYSFHDDRRVFIFDLYNGEIYPSHDGRAQERIDCNVPVRSGCTDVEYLSLLEAKLPKFLDAAAASRNIQFAIYNAGTDVYREDSLGQLALSAEAVLKRDLFVIRELKRRSLPTLMLPSGGYTDESHRLIYRTLSQVFREIHPL